MSGENSISVIVPALNEERGIEDTIKIILNALKKKFTRYEIIIFDDGSTDRTAEITDKLADTYNCIQVFHHKKPICIGGSYKKGISLAKMEYLIRINGKNDITEENLDKIFALAGVKDLVIPYMTNARERSFFRRSVSRAFTVIVNLIFGLNLKYYNHYVLSKRSAVNSIDLKTDSYAFQAEILVKLIKAGCSYIEVPVEDKFDKCVKTKAFSFANIAGVVASLWRLAYDIRLKK
ncbi:MAG: glycosyltransferase family 2 protein [Candidatus Omnitrophica bacterium]|nr:glycosyltransferase family 2 protein [Candidatus Omnitrophota bacterium]